VPVRTTLVPALQRLAQQTLNEALSTQGAGLGVSQGSAGGDAARMVRCWRWSAGATTAPASSTEPSRPTASRSAFQAVRSTRRLRQGLHAARTRSTGAIDVARLASTARLNWLVRSRAADHRHTAPSGRIATSAPCDTPSPAPCCSRLIESLLRQPLQRWHQRRAYRHNAGLRSGQPRGVFRNPVGEPQPAAPATVQI